MITTGSVKDISSEYDEIWLIVRSLKSMPYVENTQVFHVPQLSPSPELFQCYLSWRNGGRWNEDTFKNHYTPRFMKEMQSKEAQDMLSVLRERSKTKHILLACYCPDESLCHRSLVVKLLQPTFYCLVVGSRGFNNYPCMYAVLDKMLSVKVAQGYKIVIVSGGAKGADSMAEQYADQRGYEKHIMPADWNTYGRSAGFKRNEEMHQYIAIPSARERGVVAFWDMQSAGTKHSFELAKKYNNPIRVYDYTNYRFIDVQQYT